MLLPAGFPAGRANPENMSDVAFMPSCIARAVSSPETYDMGHYSDLDRLTVPSDRFRVQGQPGGDECWYRRRIRLY